MRMKSGRYRFGVFEFDAETLELRRQGAMVHLQSQPARVLACLIQNSDRTVTREELRAAIWGNETFVDFERGLNFCISQIRSALGDDSARPIYIQTLPKRGYQFVAPVEVVSSEVGAQEIPAKIPASTSRQPARMVDCGRGCDCSRRGRICSVTFLVAQRKRQSVADC